MGLNEIYNNLKGWAAWDFKAYHLEKNEADIVIKALEKQKPQLLKDAELRMFTVGGNCPACGNRFFSVRDQTDDDPIANYCRYCGQRITWEGKAET